MCNSIFFAFCFHKIYNFSVSNSLYIFDYTSVGFELTSPSSCFLVPFKGILSFYQHFKKLKLIILFFSLAATSVSPRIART